MPTLHLEATSTTSLNWRISDLSNPWNTYTQARLSASSIPGPSQYIGQMSANSSTLKQTHQSSASTGLSAGNTYTLYASVQRNGMWYNAGSETITMPLPTVYPPTISSRFQGGFDLVWDSVENASTYFPEYRLASGGSWSTVTSTNQTSASLTVGTYGVTYEFRMRVVFKNGVSVTSNNSYLGTSQPRTPSISGQVTQGSTFTIYASVSEGNWENIVVEGIAANGSTLDSKIINQGSSQRYAQWINVPAGQRYTFRARSYFNTLYSPYSNVVALQNNRPENFSWNRPKVKNEAFNLTASEWNNFTWCIDQFRQYKGKTTYGFTSAESGSPFYAYMFNQAVNAINDIISLSPSTALPPTKQKGDIISAADLNRLKDSLNSIQ